MSKTDTPFYILLYAMRQNENQYQLNTLFLTKK